jgi:hypothetical protein
MEQNNHNLVMHEIVGDIWQEHAEGAVVAITTSGTLTKNGKAVMLRGCARQARDRFPDLPQILGEQLLNHGRHVFDLGRRIVSFPVEVDSYRNPELGIIEASCRELVELADYKGWQKIVVPRPGCGGGGLEWPVVKPVLERYFDARFYVITMQGTDDATGQNW